MVKAFHRAGVMVDPALFEAMDAMPGVYMEKYKGRPEFDEGFFKARVS